MRTRPPDPDMVRDVSFEPVGFGWVAFGAVMLNDWPSGTGNAMRVLSEPIMRLGTPGHLPGLVPGSFPV
jgi:hypothetical protein